MLRKTGAIVWRREFLKSVVQHLLDPSGYGTDPFDGLVARFCTQTVLITPDSVFDDFVYADLGGELEIAAWVVPVNEGAEYVAGKVQLEAVAGADPVEEMIQGCALIDPSGETDQWVAWFPFREDEGAVAIANVDDICSFDMLAKFSANVPEAA